MKSFFAAIGMAALAAIVALGQAPQHQPGQHEANQAVKGGGTLPAGWQMRLDSPQDKPESIRFMAMGTGFHVMTGPAGIFYRSDAPKSATYQVQATFTQMEATPHGEAYGLFIGGADLQGASQKYTYFLVRQDGRFLVKRRDGANTPTITDWTAHASVKKTEGSTRGTNALAIAVTPDKVRFLVNGTEVASAAANRVDTKGIAGLRINHELNVHIEGFGVK
jgi:hypothetical protein